ncbi:MAG: hypothetical protein ACXVEF_28390 [Polyangiales bacterium]
MRSRIFAPALLSIVVSGCGDGGGSGDEADAAFTPAAAPDAGVAQPDAPGSIFDADVPSNVEYSPYFYTWAWESSAYSVASLVAMLRKTGTKGATLGFVVSRGGACEATREIQTHMGDVVGFIAEGGTVRASFGGFNETYLEEACTDPTTLASVIATFVDDTNIHALDFDLEKVEALTDEVNARRSAALKRLQTIRSVDVSFTLASNPRSKTGVPGGVRPAGLAALQSAVAAGVVISRVNLLTMDFGSEYSLGLKMGDLAVSALTDAVEQLKTLYPGITEAQAYRMLGVTPMIGQNDRPTEIFTLEDVATLMSFVRQKRLGFLSFWAIQRDQPICTTTGLNSCSQAQTVQFEFSRAFLSRL